VTDRLTFGHDDAPGMVGDPTTAGLGAGSLPPTLGVELGARVMVGALYPTGGEPASIVQASEGLVDALARLPEASAAARVAQPGVDARPARSQPVVTFDDSG
jgi:hypothetical protein